MWQLERQSWPIVGGALSMVTSWPMEENEVMETTHHPIAHAHHSSTTFYCHCHYSLSYQLILVDSLMPVRSHVDELLVNSLMPVRSHVDECVVFVDPRIKSTAAASMEAKRHAFQG
jgi:hypothetical protein